MRVWSAIPVAGFIGGAWLGTVWWHVQVHGALNIPQAALALFCAVNLWVCLSEIALFVHAAQVKRKAKSNERKLGVGKLPPIYLIQPVELSELFGLRHWAQMWSDYCALDPSYADSTSFGFCIDVGNGFTTVLPSLAFMVGMTRELMDARWLGMVGLISFYQARRALRPARAAPRPRSACARLPRRRPSTARASTSSSTSTTRGTSAPRWEFP